MTSHGGNSSKSSRSMHRDDDAESTSSISSSSSSSNNNRDQNDCLERKKRHLPHGVFACALKSTRLKELPVNFSTETVFGNPNYANVMKLYCRTGWFLNIDNNGKVSGVRENYNPNSYFEITSADQRGHVRIRNVQTNLYIAFNKKGRLYGEQRNDLENVMWLEEMLGLYNTYLSRSHAHLGWYLAIKKSGKPKKGSRTEWGQKAIQFLPSRR